MAEISAIHRISMFCSPGQTNGIRHQNLHHCVLPHYHTVILTSKGHLLAARIVSLDPFAAGDRSDTQYFWNKFSQIAANILHHQSCCYEKSARTCLLILTDILHRETVALVEIGDVVLAAELHAVRDPNRCVVHVKEALPV